MASGFLDVASTLTPGSSCQTGDNWGDGILINTPKNISLPTGMVQWSQQQMLLERLTRYTCGFRRMASQTQHLQ